jgi:ribose 1,5-bisphosphokinase
VLITASAQRLQERLAGRGRETVAQAAARLDRADAYAIDDPRLVTIVNDGALDEAAQRFVDLLAALMPPARPACSNGVHRPT